MAEFTYVFRGRTSPATPELTQQRMQKWGAWIKDLEHKGQLRNPGSPLASSGKVVKGEKKAVADGPYGESKDVVGGYMVVVATDIDHAVEIAKGCPVFEAGGSVEIRPALKLAM